MKGSSSSKVIGIIVVIAAVAIIGYLGWSQVGGAGTGSISLKKDAYYAVFLSNNQTYFGRLSDVGSQYVDLKDIYYLDVTQPLQQQSDASGNPATPSDQAKISLIKLGKELHGPTDNMKINRDQSLLFEELKDDSKVVQTIKKGTTLTD